MTGLVVFTVVDVLLLIAGLAFYLFWVGSLLTRIAGNLEECAEIVRTIVGHAKLIGPGVEHINETGGVVAGALPLLYGMAEDIVTGVTPRPEPPAVPEPARPASGTRRSRLLDAVGFAPEGLAGWGRGDAPGPWPGWVRTRWSRRSTRPSTPGRTAGRCSADGRPRSVPWRSAPGAACRRPAPHRCRCRPSTWIRRP